MKNIERKTGLSPESLPRAVEDRTNWRKIVHNIVAGSLLTSRTGRLVRQASPLPSELSDSLRSLLGHYCSHCVMIYSLVSTQTVQTITVNFHISSRVRRQRQVISLSLSTRLDVIAQRILHPPIAVALFLCWDLDSIALPLLIKGN